MELLSIIAFALALSMDGFGAGVVYGMRKIHIPLVSVLVIGLTSATAVGASMFFGHLVARVVSVRLATAAGSLILIVMGLRMILLARAGNRPEQAPLDNENADPDDMEAGNSSRQVCRFKIRCLGLVIQILREPVTADVDRSGHISVKEALLLSLALAVDALVAGFGAAMTGFKPMVTPLIVGPASALWVELGVLVGKRFASNVLGSKAAVLPGWVLICLGLARVIRI